MRERTVMTVFGKVRIKRTGYSRPGKSSLFPLDAVLNLPEGIHSYGIRKALALEVSKSSFSEATDSIRRQTGVRMHKRQAEHLSRKAVRCFDEYYEQTCSLLPGEAEKLPLLILTTDGKGIVVRKEDLREETRKKAENARRKLNKRISKGEKKNRKRMATVASVYHMERFVRSPESVAGEFAPESESEKKGRPRPVAKRVWASLEKSREDVIREIFEEALRRDPSNSKKWVCLVDGDPHQLKSVNRQIEKFSVSAVVILDIIHVIEYLWKAARVFHDEASRTSEKWVSERLLGILRGRASLVAGGMRRSATLLKIRRSSRKPVDVCADYLLKNSPYLRYNEYLGEGLPIATGVIEGACRHLIRDRMDITGARWSLEGAEAVLKLRSLRSSGDFDDYWKFYELQEFDRNHYSKYSDPAILDELSSKEFVEGKST
ncbi:Uncharacterized protein dnm_033110 [Desulfonema magnum]|uniref:ISKra4 family transposase n=1 Tax=Desulfonema magnum TaxID=45655 RepID=A0A975GMT8_9BACT|nr:Uncharacterized protein dnm_033110 [Desulfonema magnum]